jgi:Ca2+:H+ antiporter
MVMDRSMTLYFHSYETVCLLLCTLIVAAVLQGGTTNWMVGAMLIGIYTMFAAGIWFHEIENLNTSMDPIR